MSIERYVGEARALRHFLLELQPLVLTSLGADALLHHRIDRALKRGDLASLRNARQMFHNQSGPVKRQLMHGIFEGQVGSSSIEASDDEMMPAPGGGACIRFATTPAAVEVDADVVVDLHLGPSNDNAVEVLIKPGTLPSAAAASLKRIAAWIERDRRLLSRRHWSGLNTTPASSSRAGGSTETLD